MTDKSSDEMCDLISEFLFSQIRDGQGYGGLSANARDKLAKNLKALVSAIKSELQEQAK